MNELRKKGGGGHADRRGGPGRVVVITRFQPGRDPAAFDAVFSAVYQDYLAFLERQDGMLSTRLVVGTTPDGARYELTCWTSEEHYTALTHQPECGEFLRCLASLAAVTTDITTDTAITEPSDPSHPSHPSDPSDPSNSKEADSHDHQ